MVALKEEYAVHMDVQASAQNHPPVILHPIGQTIWRREHDIRTGGAPHFYTGAMRPGRPPANEVRVGYRNRVDDPAGADYEYIGFAYRAHLLVRDLPPGKDVLEARLILHPDETVWQVEGESAEQPVSAASRLLVLEAPLQSGEGAFYTPAYTYCELPNVASELDKATFSPADGLQIDVTPIVQAWVRGAAANHGLVIAGPSEAFEHNNDVQETTYGAVTLVIRLQP